MKDFLIYQIEVAICITAFSVLYFLLWKKETNFQFKRFLLLSIPILSILIPLLNIKLSLVSQKPALEYLVFFPNQFILPLGIDTARQSDPIGIWQILSVLWISGAFIMFIRLMISYWKIWQIYKLSEKSSDSKYKLINNPIQSFSFFKLIVINKYQAKTGSMDHILAHEQAHSNQWHSMDVVFFETLKMLQWFNPFIWLLTHECKQNLEYLADQEATTSAYNKEKYQYAILHHAANFGYQLLKSQFSKTNLKNRIIMMNRPNNSSIHAGKLLVLLPLLGILFMSFSLNVENLDLKNEIAEVLPIFTSSESNTNKSISSPSVGIIESLQESRNGFNELINDSDSSDNVVFTIVENQPYPSTGDIASYYEKINADLNYPQEAKEKNIKGRVFVQFIVNKDGSLRDVVAVKGLGYGCDEEAVRVIKNGPKWISGKQRGVAVNVRFIMPVGFGVDLIPQVNKVIGEVKDENGNPLISCNVIIKGTTTGTITDHSGRFILEVKPEHSALVFSYVGLISEIVPITKETNYNIVLKVDPDYATSSELTNSKVVVGHPNVHSEGIAIRGVQSFDAQPLYIIDGKEIDHDEIAEINSNDIESISVLKDESAETIYGDKGKNGVILITTKEAKSKESVYTDVTIIDDNNKEGLKLKTDGNFDFGQEDPPVFFIDGVESTEKDVKKLDRNAIESINVIKGKSAKEKYGKKGKNGVILIKTKK